MKMPAASTVPIVKELVLVGGGHSHLFVVKGMLMKPMPGVRVTLITRDVETPYSGMIPGYVAGFYSKAECHIDLRPLCRVAGVRLIHGSVRRVDLAARRVFCETPGRPGIHYDVLSVDCGIVPHTLAGGGAVPVKPITGFATRWEALLADVQVRMNAGSESMCHLDPEPEPEPEPEDRTEPEPDPDPERVQNAEAASEPPVQNIDAAQSPKQRRLTIIGGGAGGVELAFAMQGRLQREGISDWRVALATRSGAIMQSHAPSVQRKVKHALDAAGVEVLFNSKVESVAEDGALVCEGGRRIPSDHSVLCTGAEAPAFLAESGLQCSSAGGFVEVDDTLESLSHPGVFAAGDCANVLKHPRVKAGVFAVRQGMPLTENLRRALRREPLKPFRPQSVFLGLIGTGDGRAIASYGKLGLGPAKWLWSFKESLDFKFMHKFSVAPGMARLGGLEPLLSGLEEEEPLDADTAQALAMLGEGSAERAQLKRLVGHGMRCGGCGAKVGAASLARVLAGLGISAEASADDAALLGEVAGSSGEAAITSIDFFRSMMDDPFLFGEIAAVHAMGDAWAMGARPTTALALAVVPAGLPARVEDELSAMLAGARGALERVGCRLAGGHSGEGAELALGFAITGLAPGGADKMLQKGERMREELEAGELALLVTKPIGTGVVLAADMRAAAPRGSVEAAIASMRAPSDAAATTLLAHGALAATDVTGFALAGHVLEMLRNARTATADEDVAWTAQLALGDVPVLPGAAEAAALGVASSLWQSNKNACAGATRATEAARAHPSFPLLFDPVTAGGLLAAVPVRHVPACIAALRDEAGCPHTQQIGVIRAVRKGGGTAEKGEGKPAGVLVSEEDCKDGTCVFEPAGGAAAQNTRPDLQGVQLVINV